MQQSLASRVRWLVEEVAQNIVGLDLALFFQAHPSIFDTVVGIANRVARPPAELQGALERLVDAGILKAEEVGAGRHRCYSLNRTEEVWDLLCRLSELYLDDANARRQIIRMLVRRRTRKEEPAPRDDAPGKEGA